MAELTKEEFLKDVATHQIHVLHDDGIYRHIQFKQCDSTDKCFSLVTYPNHLVYSGDMGCFVFSRIHDMFDFFSTKNPQAKECDVYINLGYWSEKLIAPHPEKAQEFAENLFDYQIMKYLTS